MNPLVIIIIIFFVLWLFRRPIRQFIYRKMAEIFARGLLKTMGFREPERPKKKARRRSGARAEGGWQRPAGQRRGRRPNEPIIPKEYAVDVEFTEIKETVRTFKAGCDGDSYEIQEQVSDAEWTEIKAYRKD